MKMRSLIVDILKNSKYLLLVSALMLSGSAFAEEGLSGANTAWIMTSTALVLFMTLPGLALFYAGLVGLKMFYPF